MWIQHGVFTEKEIKSLVDFLQVRPGQEGFEKIPELMQKSMLVARTHMEIVGGPSWEP